MPARHPSLPSSPHSNLRAPGPQRHEQQLPRGGQLEPVLLGRRPSGPLPRGCDPVPEGARPAPASGCRPVLRLLVRGNPSHLHPPGQVSRCVPGTPRGAGGEGWGTLGRSQFRPELVDMERGVSADFVPGAAAGSLSILHTLIYSLCKPGGLGRWPLAFAEEGSEGQSWEDHS